jgi:hypothetical protein
MDHESRQVVLGLRVQEVVDGVDPVNCHPPAVEISHPLLLQYNLILVRVF